MGAALNVDWDKAKLLIAKGFTAKQVAEEMGLKECTVASRARRHGWRETIGEVQAIVHRTAARAVEKSLGELAEDWVKEMVNDVQESTKVLRTIAPGRSIKTLGEREAVAEKLTKRGRTMFGLDQQTGPSVQIAFFNSPVSESQTIEVQSVVPEKPE